MQLTAALGLVAYLVAVAAPLSVVAWGVLARRRGLPTRTAIGSAAATFLVLAIPPLVGFVVDSLRYPVECGPTEECYDFVFWWAAIPVGLLLGAAVFGATMLRGRRE